MADLANPHPPSEGSIEALSFRINLYLVLGVASYTALLTGLHRGARISLLDAIDYPPGQADYDASARAAQRLLGILTATLLTPHVLLLGLGPTGAATPTLANLLHVAALACTLLLLLCPVGLDGRARPGPAALARTLARCLRTRMAEPEHGKFGDLLVSDGLVSYGRALPELLTLALKCAGLDSQAFERTEFGFVLLSVVFVWPLVVRATQCYRDHGAINARLAAADRPRDRRQEANMYKYLVSMVTSLTIRIITWETSLNAVDGAHEPSLRLWRHVWRVLAFANLGYSFYWDVAQDWGLDVFALQRGGPALRSNLLLGPPALYWGVVALDLLARFPWLAPGVHIDERYPDWTPILLGSLEVLRRGVWCFFRTEWQVIVHARAGDKMGEAPPVDGVELEERSVPYRD